MKFIYNIFIGASLILSATACSEEDYKLYDTTQKDSVFFEYRNDDDELDDEVSYNFGYDISTVRVIDIPVTLMGVPKDYDRTIDIVPVADKTSMVEGVNYTITGNVIPANEVSGTVQVNLLRDNDPDILTQAKTVVLTIAENEDLKSVGENSMTITYSDIRPDDNVTPSWWTRWSPLPVYSFRNAQYFFDYFHREGPKANIDTYNEMINRYGKYFEKATNMMGPFAMYEVFLQHYVLIPLYNDHPEIGWQSSPLH